LKELLFSDGFGFAIKFYQKLGFFSIFCSHPMGEIEKSLKATVSWALTGFIMFL